MICRAEIKNAPERCTKKYIVVTLWDSVLWYWGAWDDEEAARKAMANDDNASLILMEREG